MLTGRTIMMLKQMTPAHRWEWDDDDRDQSPHRFPVCPDCGQMSCPPYCQDEEGE